MSECRHLFHQLGATGRTATEQCLRMEWRWPRIVDAEICAACPYNTVTKSPPLTEHPCHVPAPRPRTERHEITWPEIARIGRDELGNTNHT
jgi:hypothetical protein